MLGIFDSHAHYDDERFDSDREELLSSMASLGVEYIMNVGSNIENSKKSAELAARYPFIYGSVGVHPEECGSMTDEDIDTMRALSGNEKIAAIGEIGLDYHWPEPDHDTQKKWFRKQMELAAELGMPVIIHSRDAANDTMDIVKEYSGRLSGIKKGVIHCYSGSKEMAKEYIAMGFFIGIGGVVTFKNAPKLKSVVDAVSIENIVIETDCPYMAPEPYRGKRNDSSLLRYVVDCISEIKGIDREDVISITRGNALRMYRIGRI